MYHDGICVCRGARLGGGGGGGRGGGDLSATDEGLWGNNSCMRSCFPSLNGVSMSLGPCVACRLSEVVDLARPSCIISLLNHVGCVFLHRSPPSLSLTCSRVTFSLPHLPGFLHTWGMRKFRNFAVKEVSETLLNVTKVFPLMRCFSPTCVDTDVYCKSGDAPILILALDPNASIGNRYLYPIPVSVLILAMSTLQVLLKC